MLNDSNEGRVCENSLLIIYLPEIGLKRLKDLLEADLISSDLIQFEFV